MKRLDSPLANTRLPDSTSDDTFWHGAVALELGVTRWLLRGESKHSHMRGLQATLLAQLPCLWLTAFSGAVPAIIVTCAFDSLTDRSSDHNEPSTSGLQACLCLQGCHIESWNASDGTARWCSAPALWQWQLRPAG